MRREQAALFGTAVAVRTFDTPEFAGMDVVEVSPPYDVAEITALAAATVAWDYIAMLAPHATR